MPMSRVVDIVAARRCGGDTGRSSARTWPGFTAPTIWFRSPAAAGRARSPTARVPARLEQAGVTTGMSIETRKPDWLRPKVHLGQRVMRLKRSVRELGLVTVCEDAGCPNLSECWSDGTATLMLLGDRARACGFCLVDTRKPLPPALDEPARVAEAVRRMDLDHIVLTMVARDDLADGGMAHVARCVEAIRDPTRYRGRDADLRCQGIARFALRCSTSARRAQPQPRDGRQAAAHGAAVGGLRAEPVGPRPRQGGGSRHQVGDHGRARRDEAEIVGALADLAGVGCDIVTIGQYLRPTTHHLPWRVGPAVRVRPLEDRRRARIGHVEASPLTRSSYHARSAAATVSPVTVALSAR